MEWFESLLIVIETNINKNREMYFERIKQGKPLPSSGEWCKVGSDEGFLQEMMFYLRLDRWIEVIQAEKETKGIIFLMFIYLAVPDLSCIM